MMILCIAYGKCKSRDFVLGSISLRIAAGVARAVFEMRAKCLCNIIPIIKLFSNFFSMKADIVSDA